MSHGEGKTVRVSPQAHEILFQQLETKFVNQIITRASKTAHSDNGVVAQLRQFCMNARKRSLRKIDCVRCDSAPQFAKTFAFGKRVNFLP